jgi:lysozyme family protein
MSKTWTYEGTKNGYAKKWDGIKIKPGVDAANANSFANKIIAGEASYRAVQDEIGVPWYFVGALHMRESSCSFGCVLHNGEKIIGTRKKTKLVPEGRGPFSTWKDAAVDALTLKHLDRYAGQWCPALMGYQAEEFNGEGYINHGVNSPYVYAGSNWEQTGKYIADHVWDKDFDDPQIGVMTVIAAIAAIRLDVDAELHANHVPAKSVITVKNVAAATGGVVVTGAGINEATTDSSSTLDQLAPLLHIFQSYGPHIATVFTVAVVIGCVGWHFYQKYQANVAA